METTQVHFTIAGDDTIHTLEFAADAVALGDDHVKHMIRNLWLTPPVSQLTIVHQAADRADAFTLVREALTLQHQAGYLLGRTFSAEASQEAIDRAAATRSEADAKTVAAWRALYDFVGQLADDGAGVGGLDL